MGAQKAQETTETTETVANTPSKPTATPKTAAPKKGKTTKVVAPIRFVSKIPKEGKRMFNFAASNPSKNVGFVTVGKEEYKVLVGFKRKVVGADANLGRVTVIRDFKSLAFDKKHGTKTKAVALDKWLEGKANL